MLGSGSYENVFKFYFAIPDTHLAEFWLHSDLGIPLAEAMHISGWAVPKDRKLIPSDAPGFGMDLKEEHLFPWSM
ncbi:MAG: hypothetical protein EB015_04425 [Methylocystaceae bacterium]|nr:hypothetical protein [Methylocystaceae bacterium]